MCLLARLHRWLGVGFCLLLTMWFGTGFVMMYVPFPALAETARLAAAPPAWHRPRQSKDCQWRTCA